MPRSAEEIEGLLRARGHALTPQRRAIVRHLVERGGHWTAASLLEGVTREFPMASRATVYNCLALLREVGAVVEVPVPGSEARFDANTDPHQHFLCLSCGHLEDVPSDWFPVALRADAQPDFELEGFRVIGQGRCARCR